jgi:hypothetical protein
MNNEQNSKNSTPSRNQPVAYAIAFALGVGTGVGGTVLYAQSLVKCCIGTSCHCHSTLWGGCKHNPSETASGNC